ncbi:hypothetical protein FJ955_03880 [Mesorhizobium sp. B2-2-2]|uniref:hypothetical protein n=1 Tax=Mesorhizobium sp. B2-2-2 TaxID=2589964 RepID=UPI00112A98DF|nr:hypothetical protein [Mesorhizobium sp. B2-2-2]TPM33883.1 hypothetical protein FJ955_03880 [Mesorhizobium sp. B2-2-2]
MTYSFIAHGYCLSPLVPDGSLLQADPSQPIYAGQLVAVVLKQEGSFRGFSSSLEGNSLLGVTKVFLGRTETAAGEWVYLFGQFDPPTVLIVPRKHLEAMHLIANGEGPSGAAEIDDAAMAETMDLLTPFIRGGVAEPIGTDWRPPTGDLQ